MISTIGFVLASYSVIGNDVIQTLGTFIQSNKQHSWWKLFLYIGGILTVVLLLGWYINSGDATYGRLNDVVRPKEMTIWHLVPPILLVIITRFGIPVSTTFLILSIFSSQVVFEGMLLKSLLGYFVSFVSAYLVYYYFLNCYENDHKKIKPKTKKLWLVLQWFSTAFLWSQWLIQDFANIYIYLPAQLDFFTMILSLLVMLFILGLILTLKGGAIQKVVSNKINSSNIRSATFIDFIYGSVLLFFTTLNNIPMSTTWAFVGILAGREIAIRKTIDTETLKAGYKIVVYDFIKVTIGIVISVSIVFLLKKSQLI